MDLPAQRSAAWSPGTDLSKFPIGSDLVHWQTGVPCFNGLSSSEAVDILFPLLTVEDAEVRRRNAERLASLLSDVILERFASPPPGTNLWRDAPLWLHSALSALDRLAEHIAEAVLNRLRDPSSFTKLCNALGSQPGLVTTLGVSATSSGNQELNEFVDLFDAYHSPRQIALAPTYSCSGGCSYCYSQGLASRFPHAMTIASFRQVVAWMKLNGIGLLLLAGGEPTQYPHLHVVLEILRKAHLRAYMATNNLFDDRWLDALDNDVIDRVSIHLWHQDRYSTELWERFRQNLDMWCRKGISVSLRYNLLDHRDYPSSLFDVCDQFDIQHISVGLPFPVRNGAYVSQEDFALFAPLLIDLTKEAQGRGIGIYLAKPLPWCAFSEGQVSFLKRANMFSAVCSIYHHRGTHNLLVNPDLSTFACQALPVPGPNLLSFPTIRDVADEYEGKVRAALLQPLYDKCVDCYYLAQRACQGACLAYKRIPSILPLTRGERLDLHRRGKVDEIVSTESR